MRKPIIAVVGMLAIAVLSTAAQQKMAVPIGTLEGIVVDAHDKPVANASVTIQTSDGQQPHATRGDGCGYLGGRTHPNFPAFRTRWGAREDR